MIYVWPQGDEYLNSGQPSLPQYDQEALAHYNEYYSRYVQIFVFQSRKAVLWYTRIRICHF
jgi:hypothetical protein